jgi:Ca-activated chloride channel family protein
MGGMVASGVVATVWSAGNVAARWCHGLPTACLVAAALTTPISSSVFAACPSENRDVLLILDASNSMLHNARFDAARDAVASDLDLLPANAKVALRLYGSRSPALRSDCQDSELRVPFGPAASNRALIVGALASTRPQGITPIAYALREATSDFPQGAADRTIVLMSDGAENCGGDVCAAAGDLARAGIVINTVAVQADNNGQRQLQCIAHATGGAYFPAPTTTALADQIAQALGICPVA